MISTALLDAMAEAVDDQHEEVERSATVTAADLVAAAVAGYGTEVCTVRNGRPVTTGLRLNRAGRSAAIAAIVRRSA